MLRSCIFPRQVLSSIQSTMKLFNESISPSMPASFSLRPTAAVDLKSQLPPKDWPHAPVHRLSQDGIYMVTAGTLHKRHLFDSEAKRDLLEGMLLSFAKQYGWQLEAWAVFVNHYHFVARGNPSSSNLRVFVGKLHAESARQLNERDNEAGRQVWHNFWDTRLTYQHAYLARLNYVHQNAVKHGLVSVANQYPWCSAAWFERVASPAQVKTIYTMKIDRVQVEDDF
jgi:putative transposase